MARGIMGLLGLAAALAVAVPAGLVGVDYLLQGRPLGAAFLGIAGAVLLLEEYVTRPTDLPGELAGRVVGAVAKRPEEDD